MSVGCMLKCFRDQIYGMVDIHPLCYTLIHIPEFQRLRDIRQLNNLHYLYPGATHDRFQHCIGVYHLAEVFVERLQKIQPELHITEEEKLCVCIAGLYHDIGHIVMGHLYPLYVHYCKSRVLVEHEIMSCYIFKYIITKYKLLDEFKKYNLTEDHVHLICEIMLGDAKKAPDEWVWKGAPGREFLLQIVANAKSGVDVDRFDYMLRDCLNLGLNCSYNYDRIIKGARVIRNKENEYEICFNEKVNIDVMEMFQCRMSLHRRAYSHKTNRIIDHMLIEAMMIAEKHGFAIQTAKGPIPLSLACTNLDAYIRATDYLILEVKNSVCEEYKESRSLIQRVEKKDLYRFVGEVIINSKGFQDFYLKDPRFKSFNPHTVEKSVIAEFEEDAKKNNLSFDSSLLVVDVVKLTLSGGNSNPLSIVSFFNESNINESYHLPASELSNTLPEQYEDWLVRLYNRGNDNNYNILCQLFSIWRTNHLKNEIPEKSTLKRRRTYSFPSSAERRFKQSDFDTMNLQLIISKFSSQIIMQSKNDYVDEKVKSILTDLGYTKTRHHDIYKNIQPFWNEEMHRRCLAAIFDYGLKEASPKVIYPALKEYNASLRPENIKSHLQKYRSNSKANQMEYLHFFERYLRKEKKAALRAQSLQNQNTNGDSEHTNGNIDSTSTSYHIHTDNSSEKQTTGDQSYSSSNLSKVPSFVSSRESYYDDMSNPMNSIQQHMKDDYDDDPNQIFRFQEDPSMATQVALHDDIISKHSVRQQRMGLDGIDNDNRYLPSLDYNSFFANASTGSEQPTKQNDSELGNPLYFLQDTDN